jgi:hypothetical protein
MSPGRSIAFASLLDRQIAAFNIRNFTGIVSAIEPRQITVQVALADVMIRASQTPLQNVEERLHRIGRDSHAVFVPDVFFCVWLT